MITRKLLEFIFSGACLWRWNDKLRPVQLSEIEKQGHKMLIANLLLQQTEPRLTDTQLETQMIEGALFDYFYRLIITDIKPPVYYKICQEREHYLKLTEFVLTKLEPILSPLGEFWTRCQNWHLAENRTAAYPGRILNAAHLMASQWEFKLIEPLNSFDEEMPAIGKSFIEGLNNYKDLPGMDFLLNKEHAAARFINLCGQLRFQIRWTQTARMPQTTVLGHMFMVATFAYLFSLAINACQKRGNNNFFSGLFHDFPEVLTRDIISPVKKSWADFPQIIRKYEGEELERRVLEPLRKAGLKDYAKKISWYLGLEIDSEFQECCLIDGKLTRVANFAELAKYNEDVFQPKDGSLLKMCDLLSAFMEAHISINNGVSSPQLRSGRDRMSKDIIKIAPDSLNINDLLDEFKLTDNKND